ncbi:MAG: alpha/beta hydrolase [Thermoguttaceae bacterium]
MKKFAPLAFLLFLLSFLTLCSTAIWAEDVSGQTGELILWKDGAPNALGSEEKDVPKLLLYPAPKTVDGLNKAVLVCPGGGYGGLAMDHEGDQIGKWFQSIGVSAYILDYRHRGKGYGHPNPLLDAQRGIRTIRANAADWGIDPEKIGIMGFSAGGHLASTAGTHFDAGKADSSDPIERVSSRPDFLILCYPVIMFDSAFTHNGTQTNLLGKEASKELIDSYSNEKMVTENTPPTFLFQTDADKPVPAENAVAFYMALRKNKVPAEMHIFEHGPHGIGLAKGMPGNEVWPELCRIWLNSR